MNLLEVRSKLREISGRFDLVNEDSSNNGADFYIQNGCKFLDLSTEIKNSEASCFRFLTRGLFSISIPNCRVVKSVRGSNSEGCWTLKKKDLKDMFSEYFSNFDFSDFGSPTYYSLIPSKYIPPELTANNFESFLGATNFPAENIYGEKSLIFNIPVELRTSFEVSGFYYSEKLAEDLDENFWSSQHPMLLIMATMRGLEIINRNTQGVNDWTRSIMMEIEMLNKDFVDECITDVNNSFREA